jgi:GTPase involved in cell partitioning and DNA repair
LSPSKPYITKDDKPGGTTRRQGTKGDDLIIEVPLGTEVFENDELLFVISEDSQEEMVLEGRKGSLGSISLSGNSYKAREYEHKAYRKGPFESLF